MYTEAGPGLGGALLTPKGKETPVICGFGVGVRQSYPSGAVSSIFRNMGLGTAYETVDEHQHSPLPVAVTSPWSFEGRLSCIQHCKLERPVCALCSALKHGECRVTHNRTASGRPPL